MSKINWRTVSDEEINTWPILGRGGERVVRLDPNNPTQCVKLSSKTLAMQTEREADYLQELEDKGIRSKYVPRFYGCIETPTQGTSSRKRFDNKFDSFAESEQPLSRVDFLPIR